MVKGLTLDVYGLSNYFYESIGLCNSHLASSVADNRMLPMVKLRIGLVMEL